MNRLTSDKKIYLIHPGTKTRFCLAVGDGFIWRYETNNPGVLKKLDAMFPDLPNEKLLVVDAIILTGDKNE